MASRTSTLVPPRGRWFGPLGRDERMWLVITVIWALSMFAMIMFIWPAVGEQQNTMETYKVDPAEFRTLTQNFIQQYRVGEIGGVPVVAPPPGSDVYLQSSRFQWTPILQLKEGETYRFQISSIDVQHGFSLQPDNVNFQVLPDYVTSLEMTPHEEGEYTILCNEFCGLGHHVMVGRIIVTE